MKNKMPRLHLPTRALINTIELAPDRYLAVFGVLLAIFYPFAQIFFHDQNSWLLFIVVLLNLPIALYFTYWLAKKDPSLYSAIITKGVSSNRALSFLCNESLEIINAVEKERLKKDGEILVALDKNEKRFTVIEKTKPEIAERFGLSARVFCDQFFRFSPSILKDRVTKLGLNDEFSKWDLGSDTYKSNLSDQSSHVEQLLETRKAHLTRLRDTRIDLKEVEALFKAESTSGSVQRLAYILSSHSLNEDDIVLLFEILGAYRGRSLYHRLLTISVLIAEEQLESLNAEAPSEPKSREILNSLETRIRLLLYGDIRSRVGNLAEVEKKRSYLTHWWEEVAEHIHSSRNNIIKESWKQRFKSRLNKLPGDGKLTIVVDSYSRAVRSAIREAAELDNRKDSVRVFVVFDDRQKSDFAARLMHHVLVHESKVMLEVVSGDITLLNSISDRQDMALYLTGAASIDGARHIHTTTHPGVVKDISSIYKGEEAGHSRIKKIAIAGNYKTVWSLYLENTLTARSIYPEVAELFDNLNISRTTLAQDRDSLTGGLYRHQVDEILTNDFDLSNPNELLLE
tara:strand:+ start:467 stop:2176 length:1710 start_codon:yes stop_codon:yes gene_type:complete